MPAAARCAAARRLEVLEAVAGIEPRRGLVEQPDLGFLGEGPREKDPPPLASRERRRVPLGEALDVARAHRLERALAILRAFPPTSPRPCGARPCSTRSSERIGKTRSTLCGT